MLLIKNNQIPHFRPQSFIAKSVGGAKSKIKRKSKKSASFEIEEELAELLQRINLTKYSDLFTSKEITMEDLTKFEYKDLTNIGVTKYRHQKLIMDAIEEIKDFDSDSSEDDSFSAGNTYHQVESPNPKS